MLLIAAVALLVGCGEQGPALTEHTGAVLHLERLDVTRTGEGPPPDMALVAIDDVYPRLDISLVTDDRTLWLVDGEQASASDALGLFDASVPMSATVRYLPDDVPHSGQAVEIELFTR